MSTNPKSARSASVGTIGLYVILLVAFVSPLAGVYAINQYRDPIDQALSVVDPVYASARREARDASRSARLNLTWTTQAGLRAPEWSGTVTAIPAPVGTIVGEGDSVLEIDGVPRIAVRSTKPFYRSISEGMSGDDVRELNLLLDRLGYRHGLGSKWSAATGHGVNSLKERLGVENADSPVFEPTWTVWLPTDQFSIQSYNASLGGVAPPPGEEFALPAPTLASAAIVDEQDKSIELNEAQEWHFVTESVDVALPLHTRSTVAEGATLEQLRPSLGPGQQFVAGIVSLVKPEELTAVPVSSVTTDAESRTCVWFLRDGTHVPTVVQVVEGDVGVTLLAESLPSTPTLLVNPVDVIQDPQCS